ncbi:SDR family NAD(P)-dependent oxidoreductase [Emcibacter nanhaiensis]|uniref:SDR family NAD(P)-dependent oxidoreductase n=1 Tax=Emcibacter nanhaiensis TaxID=1505037 RepID=A0A501PJU3_9PROT|nr:SDR family NAD(P)-dependent oxidoreductase [Emcibacter nanhaiensis]TPD60729.1 SDR family NAD(P)-dependent oxidoreductase [Emcibacter nanhaiensis]
MQEWTGKLAVITGAASGIGKGLAEKAAALGMNLVLADLDNSGLSQLQQELTAAHDIRVEMLRTDVSRPDDLQALAELAFGRFGSVDLLFNNAGVMMTGMTWEHNLRDWNWVMGVNLNGVVNGISSFLPRMMAQGTPARIINTGSIAGFLPSPTTSIYSASKRAVISLSETLQFELEMARSKVRVSVICPGAVATQIADADRNRPEAERPVEDATKKAMKEQLRQGIAASGMDPAELADMVFAAIAGDKFWIMPHPGYLPRIREEADAIARLENPVYTPLVDM